MGIAAYNRGSAAIRQRIDAELLEEYDRAGGAVGEVRRNWRADRKNLLAVQDNLRAELASRDEEIARLQRELEAQRVMVEYERTEREEIQQRAEQNDTFLREWVIVQMRKADEYKLRWRRSEVILSCARDTERQEAERDARQYHPELFT